MAEQILGGDLYHLWRVAEVHLPRIADVYYDGTQILNGGKSSSAPPQGAQPPVVTRDTDAFRESTPAYPGAAAAMASPVGAAWTALRDEIQRMYAQIGDTVLAGSEGVRRAMEAYVAADMASADALSQYMSDLSNHDPNSPASNPPQPGDEDYPGDPVLPD